MTRRLTTLFALSGFVSLSACNRDSQSTNNTPTKAPSEKVAAPHSDSAAGHGGQVIELGTASIGGYSVRASRDQGEIKPGGDAPIDVWLTDGTSRVIAVRFWIGTQTGDESVKAKADIENPAEPNHWHTHAEAPSPLPAGSKLWVEIELEGQGKQIGSFDLKG
jgi:hypothetical protein